MPSQPKMPSTSSRAMDLTGTPMTGHTPQPGGSHVSVAIRPDDMERVDAGIDNAFEADVETVEYGGRDSLIRVSTAFGKMWARISGEYHPGEHINLRVPPSRALVYQEEMQ